MDDLAIAANAYSKLLNKEFSIKFSNGEIVRLVFKAHNFFHLAGLNKLVDLDITQQPVRAANLFYRIQKGEITWLYLTASRYFNSDARARVSCIARISELLTIKGLAVYDFDKNICRAQVRFRSSILFYKDDGHDFFITLGAAKDSDGRYFYPETLFYRFDKEYIHGQRTVTITQITEAPHK